MTRPSGGEERTARIHPVWHALPVVFVGALLVLGARSLVLDDARFGWGMFRQILVVDVDYAWVLEDGTLRPHWPGAELKGPARRLDGRPGHLYGYGRRAMRDWVTGYVRWRARRDPPPGAVALRGVAAWTVNRSGPTRRDVVEAPVPP